MYVVSREYHDHMQSARRHVLARATIDYTDPLIDQGIQATANDRARISWPEQTADGLTPVPYLWTVLDGSWTAGGARHPMPDTAEMARSYQMGWWGTTPAGPDGTFAAPYPTLAVSHAPRPIRALRVAGESMLGEYPTSFVIRLRAEDNTVLLEKTVTGNTQLDWSMSLDTPILEVATQELEIRVWSQPSTVVKITEFYTSIRETYEADNLVFVRLLEERETSHGSLPVGNISANEIVVTLLNADHRFDPDNDASPLYGLVRPRRRIKAWLGVDVSGTVEWVPLGVFWTIDWDVPDDALEATAIARDRLELLRMSTYQPGQAQQSVSLYALAEQILGDAGLGSGDYVIDTSLQSVVVPWGWLSPMSHRDALRIIAEAGLAVVYADRDGRVRVELPAVSLPPDIADAWYLQGAPFAAEMTAPDGTYAIGPDDYYAPMIAPSRQEMAANEIVVTTQPLQAPASASEVYRSALITVPAGGSVVVTARYQSPPVVEAVASLDNPPAGVSIDAATEYAWGMTVTIANSGGSAADATLVITGKPMAVSGSEQVIVRDETSIRAHGALRYELPENPLVQTREHAEAIAQGLLAMAKDPRRDIEFSWRGNPALELGDLVTVLTDAQNERRSTYAIIRQEIEWAGALSAKLTGRRI